MKHLFPLRRARWVAFAALGATMLACGGSGDKPASHAADTPAAQPAAAPTPTPTPAPTTATPGSHDTLSTPSGLRYVYITRGTGARATPGHTASVHYIGTLTSGKKFDSSRDRNEPFDVPLGAHRVIPGWEKAIALMHVGDRIIFIIPSALGYGPAGDPPDIPGNATLIFDIELLGVH